MDEKKRLLAEQLKLISSLIASVEDKVIGQDELEQQLIESTVDVGRQTADVLIRDEMEEVVKIIILEEKLAGTIAEA